MERRSCLWDCVDRGGGYPYPVLAACIFERAEDQGTAAILLHMVRQILPGDVGCTTLVWALDREPWAVVLVVLRDRERQTMLRIDSSYTPSLWKQR